MFNLLEGGLVCSFVSTFYDVLRFRKDWERVFGKYRNHIFTSFFFPSPSKIDKKEENVEKKIALLKKPAKACAKWNFATGNFRKKSILRLIFNVT